MACVHKKLLVTIETLGTADSQRDLKLFKQTHMLVLIAQLIFIFPLLESFCVALISDCVGYNHTLMSNNTEN